MDRQFVDQTEAITADKRGRVLPATTMRRKVLALDVARANEHLVLPGDFLFADRNSTGTVEVRLNSTGEDPWPLTAQDGVRDVPMRDVFITHAAQPGLIVNLWYGFRARFLAGANSIASIGSILNPVNLNPEDARYFLFGDDETADGEAFHSGSSAGAVAAQVSFVQLFNPAASGKIAYIDGFDFAGATAADRFEMRQHAAAIGALINTGFNKNDGGAAGVMQLRAGASAAPGGTVVRNWYRPINESLIASLKAPIRLAEGRGVSIISFTVNTLMVGNFDWREKAA